MPGLLNVTPKDCCSKEPNLEMSSCSVVLKVTLFPYISFLFPFTVQASLGLKSQQWIRAFHIESPQMLLPVFRTEQNLVPVGCSPVLRADFLSLLGGHTQLCSQLS